MKVKDGRRLRRKTAAIPEDAHDVVKTAIKAFNAQRDMSGTGICEKAGIQLFALNSIVRGHTPRIDVIAKVLDVLGYDVIAVRRDDESLIKMQKQTQVVEMLRKIVHQSAIYQKPDLAVVRQAQKLLQTL